MISDCLFFFATGFAKYVGQLPVLKVDDNIELTQVHAVMRFIAKQFGFNGQSEMEITRADEVCELIYELRLCAVGHKDCYTTRYPDIVRHTIFRDFRNEKSMSKKVLMRKRLMDLSPLFLDKFARYLEESDGQYVAGPNITYADLALANFLLVWEDLISPDVLNDYPTLKALKEEILELPEIAEYIEKTKPIIVTTGA